MRPNEKQMRQLKWSIKTINSIWAKWTNGDDAANDVNGRNETNETNENLCRQSRVVFDEISFVFMMASKRLRYALNERRNTKVNSKPPRITLTFSTDPSWLHWKERRRWQLYYSLMDGNDAANNERRKKNDRITVTLSELRSTSVFTSFECDPNKRRLSIVATIFNVHFIVHSVETTIFDLIASETERFLFFSLSFYDFFNLISVRSFNAFSLAFFSSFTRKLSFSIFRSKSLRSPTSKSIENQFLNSLEREINFFHAISFQCQSQVKPNKWSFLSSFAVV